AVARAHSRGGIVAARDLLPTRSVCPLAAMVIRPGGGGDAHRSPPDARTQLHGAMADGGDRLRQLAPGHRLARAQNGSSSGAAGDDRVTALERGVILYDQDCGFCKWSLDKILAWDRSKRLRAVPIQSDEGERLLA